MAPPVRHHFDRVEDTRVKCKYCQKEWSRMNDTQMRVHLSDKTTTKDKGSNVPLCLMVPVDVAAVFQKHFAEESKKEQVESDRQATVLRSEQYDAGRVPEADLNVQQPSKKVTYYFILSMLR
jgi:hypothetical protein